MFARSFILLVVALGAVNCASVNADRPRYLVDIFRYNKTAQDTVHVCDGAIIGSRYVLTAASCVANDDALDLLYIRSGSDEKPSATYLEERSYHRVRRVMYPSEFVNLPCRQHQHNIAIIKVDRAFDLSYDRLFKQANLPEIDNDYEGYNGVITGYKDLKINKIHSNIISNEHCARAASTIVTQGNICSTVSTTDAINSLQAISGSPLIHDDTIVGIKTVSGQCGDADGISKIPCQKQDSGLVLYARVSSYLEFINNVLNKEVSGSIVYKPSL